MSHLNSIAGVRQASGEGGLPCILVETELATAQIYTHGAHVAQFQPRGHAAVLWMSTHSAFTADKPLRGGVPICFPWFGPRADDASSPAHGFARLREWQLAATEQNEAGDVTLRFALAADAETLALWPHRFACEYSVSVGAALELSLRVTNTDNHAWTFEEALHTYFVARDVRQVSISGLASTRYIDKADESREKEQSGDITFTGETDRAYLDTSADCILTDPQLARRIRVSKQGSQTTVVWNPWTKKAAAMPDFGDDEWPQMLCIETANALRNAVTLQAGDSHTMQARLEVLSL
ncbi:MAG TPA: D-hexose-6-phosphate mutarotase [Abditibacteriaceae bacterium]|jgi:glucose-6-phosphate 1-epimerase